MEKLLCKLEEMTKQELEQITKQQNLSGADLDKMIKATCLLDQLESLKDSEVYGQSRGYYDGPMHHMDFDGYGNVSYARGRSRTTGRYMSRDMDPRIHDRYYARGYSSHSIADRMVDALERMYDEAGTDHERAIVETWISKIRNEA